MGDEFVCSPNKPLASPPAGYKGGPGTYNGEEGYPKRTSSPDAVPEKVRDGSLPGGMDPTAPGSVGSEGNDLK